MNNFTPLQLDVIREVSNIGCGNAATALSKVLNKRVDMEVPSVQLLQLADVPETLGGAELPMVAIMFQITGQLPCSILFMLDQGSVERMLSVLFGVTKSPDACLTTLEQSALMEVGNILSSAYLGALSEFTQLAFQLSVPAFAMDMAGAIIDIALLQIGGFGDSVLIIENTFRDGEDLVKANFLMLPDLLLMDRIFAALGVGSA